MESKKIIRYITIAALFLVPIFPLIVTKSFIFPFITGKAFFFRVIVEIAFVGWVSLALLDAKYRPKLSSLSIAVSIFAIVALIADLLGVEVLRSLWSNLERMDGWITIIHLWAFYIVITSVFGASEDGKLLWRRWLNFSLLVAGVVAIYGLFQLLGWVSFHKDFGRLDASFGNAEFLAVYMIFNVFISLYLFIVAKSKAILSNKNIESNKSFRWAYIILVVLFSFVIFETQTRAAILGLVGGLLSALILFAIFRKSESNKLRWISAGIIGLLLIAGCIFWLNRNASFIRNSPILNRFASISISDASNQSRLYIWPMALKGAMERPILGWGQENFSYVFQEHYNPAMDGQEQWFDRAHNVFLDTLVDSGIVGLLSYLMLYILFIIYIWKSLSSIGEKSILTGLLVAYAINNLFVFDNLGSYVPFFALLAYVNAFREGRQIKWFGANPMKREVVNYVALPVLTILLAVTIYFFSAKQIVVAREIVIAVGTCGSKDVNIEAFRKVVDSNVYMIEQEAREQLYSCFVGSYWDADFTRDRKQEFTELASREMANQIRSTPLDARSYYFAGLSLNQTGQIGAAETYLSKAHELSPARQMFDFEFAADLIYMKKYDQAVKVLKEAYDATPQYVQVAKAYAIALQLAGNDVQAHAILPNDALFNTTLKNVQSYATSNDSNKLFVLFKGVTFFSDDANIVIAQAQMEYSQGMVQQAIQTLLILESVHPELKTGVDGMIKLMQK